MPSNNSDQKDIDSILEGERPRSRWVWRLLMVAVLLAAGVAGWFYLRQPSGAAAAISFSTAEVTKGRLEVLVSATGTLEPVVQVDVGTEVSGTISSVEADFNDKVKAGQVLARLDTTKLKAQRDQAEAALAVARAELQNAQAGAAESKVNLERLQKAFKESGGRLPSRQDVDAAQAAYDKAMAQVAVARATITKSEASLKAYESDLDKTVIRAPIDGLILDRQVELGKTVGRLALGSGPLHHGREPDQHVPERLRGRGRRGPGQGGPEGHLCGGRLSGQALPGGHNPGPVRPPG